MAWSGEPRLSEPQVRYLAKIFTIFRWGSFGLVGIVGAVLPPPAPWTLALLVVWVAVYNGWATLALNRASNDSVRAVARAITVMDELSLFFFLAIYLPSAPGALFAAYACLVIEAVAVDGPAGAVASVVIFAIGATLLQVSRVTFLHLSPATVDLVLWVSIIAITATSMAVTSRVLLGVGAVRTEAQRGSLPLAASLHLSPREQEVLRLVADGYSNTMIAGQLHLSENTIKGHVESLLTRLNARNRAEAVAAASRLNLL
jgi:DNA-binding CsgD family transcriptional regulator